MNTQNSNSHNAFFNVPTPINEPINMYAPNTTQRTALQNAIQTTKSKTVALHSIIDNIEVPTTTIENINPPHELNYNLGSYSIGTTEHVHKAIESCLKAKKEWENMAFNDRAAIFLKAAELISTTYRYKINAATMLCQSKNAYQAEIDAVCELADFLRFNVFYAQQIYHIQPQSDKGVWNKMDYRALEGFIFAITPFNFTAIAGNLPAAAALMGNTVVWKPTYSQLYSAHVVMQIFIEAGLPKGVINLIHTDGPETGNIVFNSPNFAGLHFTGSTQVFQLLWKNIGNNIHTYKSYPRIVGETGGKDFVLVHNSANVEVVCTALVRGAFEFQGQKCSAASRAYIPLSIWKNLKQTLIDTTNNLKMGTVENFQNFINAVIDEKAYNKITNYIKKAKQDTNECTILAGAEYNNTEGYFIKPTIIQAHTPYYITMQEEIFGPVLTIYVYNDADFENMFEVINNTSNYALTGSIIATDRKAISKATHALQHAAGNLYINDKPTGAIVNQQPFGGARGSGTNDKAGSMLNLLRFTSPRAIKETLTPPTSYMYSTFE